MTVADMIDEQALHAKISKARTKIILSHPFFATLVMRLDAQLAPGMEGEAATDGRRILFEPGYLARTDDAELVLTYKHEILHCCLSHFARQAARERDKWNVATDYAINLMLRDDFGEAVPDTWLIDKKWAGMSAEQIYAQLPEPDEKAKRAGRHGGVMKPSTEGKPGQGISPAELGELEADWKVALTQAATIAKQRGRLPAGMEGLVSKELAPRVDWREILRRFVSASARHDYTWARPNRRHIANGLYLPSLHSEAVGPLVVAIDTSGSCWGVLDQFAAELRSIIEDVKPAGVTVIYCDAKVERVDTFNEEGEPFDLKRFRPKGGGGTSFVPPFEYVAEQNITPAAMIYLTDLYGPAPETEPPFPVLWACVSDEPAPWGELVKIEGE